MWTRCAAPVQGAVRPAPSLPALLPPRSKLRRHRHVVAIQVVSKDQRRLQRWQASLLELDGRPRRTHADRLCLPRLQADRTRVSAGDGEHEKGEGRRARCGR
eukprot:4506689-Prymnesium_polylepis.1